MDHNQSALVPYSTGTAAVNKPLDSRDLQIVLREVSGFMDGESSDNVDTLETTTLNRDGDTTVNQTRTSNVVTATWLPFSTNRLTPPDIRKGERLMVYRMEGTQRYFWTELGLDDNLRKLETVIYAFSANPDISIHQQSIENCYFLEVSAHRKVTTFSTSMANGEVTRFLVQMDGAAGTITIKDNHGQEVFISALDRVIRAINGDGTEAILDKQDARIYAPARIEVTAGDSMALKALNAFTADANTITITGKTQTVVSGGGASTMTLEGGGTTLDTPKFTGG